MAPVTPLAVLALAAGALAAHHDLGRRHGHYHAGRGEVGTGSDAPFPLPSANSTGIWGTTGTAGAATTSSADISSAAAPTAPLSHADAFGNYASGAAGCGADVTVTTTEQTTVYVTAGASSSASSSSSSSWSPSSSAAAASTSASSSSSSPSSSWSSSSSSSSSSSASSSSADAPTGYANKGAAEAPSSYASSSSSTASSTSSSASATSSSGGSLGSGKRGLAYNDVSLTSAFLGSSHVSWAYNWGSASDGLSSNLKYIPLLWGPSSDFTGNWNDNAKAAIEGGAEYLFSFNEPDISSQANLSPEDAASAYKQYMQPFAGQAKLSAPSVSNAASSTMGLGWLSSFLDACSDCQIDAISIHWYGSYQSTDDFKSHIGNASDLAPGKAIFVSEFGCNDGSDDDISSFLQEVMPWMDQNDAVTGYAYYMVANGYLNSGSSTSSYGSTYSSYN